MVKISFRLFYIIPVVVLILVPGLAVLSDPFPPLPFGPWKWTGVPLFLSGAALFTIAHRFIYNPSQWAEKPTPFDEPNQLVTRGPYRWVRNPLADGGFLMLAGDGVFLGVPHALYLAPISHGGGAAYHYSGGGETVGEAIWGTIPALQGYYGAFYPLGFLKGCICGGHSW